MEVINNQIISPFLGVINNLWKDMDIYFINFIILMIGLVVGKIVYLSISNILRTIKFDSFLEKLGFEIIIRPHISDIVSRIIAKICYWIILILTLSVIVTNFGFIDVPLTLWAIVRLLSKILSFISFILIGFTISLFFARMFRVLLHLIGFEFYKIVEKIIIIFAVYGVIIYSLPIIEIESEPVISATYFLLKIIGITIVVLIAIGFRNIFLDLYNYFLIKLHFTTGDVFIINKEEVIINKITFKYIYLLDKSKQKIIDNKHFLKTEKIKLL